MTSSPERPTGLRNAPKLYERAALLLRPNPTTTPDEWGSFNRTYPASAGVPGPRDPHLTPYMIPFGRAVAERRYRRVVMAMFAQGGKSDTFLDIIGQRLDQEPCPILYVGPNKQFITEQFEPRVMALLDEAPVLKGKVARGKRMTKTRKFVAGVPLRLAHAGSSTALKSDPAGLALTDEADELMANVKGQGDPIGLVDRRGETYSDFVHAIVSTPSNGPSETVLNEESGLEFWREAEPTDVPSTIWRLWQSGTRYHFAWPCPHCSEFFIPRFSCLRWPKGADPVAVLTSAHVVCPRCGGIIDNDHKADMNARGVYVAPGQRITPGGDVLGEPPPSTTCSFWVSGLCSPFSTFGERASEFLTAKRAGDQSELQTIINGGFGELWAPSSGDAPDWMEVTRRARESGYKRGEVPDGVKLINMGVDVQRHAIYWVARGWGARGTSWLIDYGKLNGDTTDEAIWDYLTDLISQVHGADSIPVRLAFVDSGFRPGKVDTLPLNRVYEFCRLFPSRVRATKGSSTAMKTPLIASRIEVTRAGKQARFGLELYRLDTDHWKSWVHERLRWRVGALGAWYLPQDTDEDYARQIVSEARVKLPSGRAQWVQRNKDNHYLDCEAMAAAAGYLLNVQRIPGEAPAPQPTAPQPEPEDDDDMQPTVRPVAVVVAKKPRRPVVRSRFLGMR